MSADGVGLARDTNDKRTATGRRILEGLTGSSRCQIGGDVHTPFRAPWRGDRRESDKTRLYEYVRSSPEGTPLAEVVRDVFGADAVKTAGADYQLARRFFNRCNWFKTTQRGAAGLSWVEPTTAAFHLSPQYANGKTSAGRGDGLSGVSKRGRTADHGDDRADCRGDLEGVDSPQYPKDRAQAVLDKRTVLDGRDGRADYRADLLGELGTGREIQQDKFKILRKVRGQGDDYLLLPYLTRFNDAGRAADIQDGFRTALSRAADKHCDAVVVTLTSDPSRHSSVSAALEGLYESKARFMSWLATDYQVGHRPDNLTVLEWTAGGLPHVHVVLFGMSWLLPQAQIAAKWDDLGQGSVVDIRSARRSRDGQRWHLHNDDGGRVTLRQYLGKAIRGLCRLAARDAGSLADDVEDGDLSLWRQALYWATERQYYSCSPSLKDTGGGDGLPHVTRYEFVGVAQYRDIPAHVRQSAATVTRGRPPPASTPGQSASRTAAD